MNGSIVTISISNDKSLFVTTLHKNSTAQESIGFTVNNSLISLIHTNVVQVYAVCAFVINVFLASIQT
ncbi:hypothetical protein HOG27_05240 [bacterium]|jgi:hypothetical protein|nr:hypothetical protein [bacterium]